MKRIILVAFALIVLIAPTKAEEGARLNAVKITFLSWATGSIKVSYERALAKILVRSLGGDRSLFIPSPELGEGCGRWKVAP
ncbi:MAG: hypothetical protein IJZ09_06195 [Tidjanibacter sp.]|nr:hypothetical protein [Tidjanibacter sp.]